MHGFKPILLLAGLVVLLGGCAAITSPALQQARASYQTAHAKAAVRQAAPQALARAKTNLQRGDKAAQHRDIAGAGHYASLANRYVTVAKARTQQARLSKQLAQVRRQKRGLQVRLRQQQIRRVHQNAVQAQRRAQQLANQLQAIGARRTSRGLVMVLSNLFASGKSSLAPGRLQSFVGLANFLKQHANRRVLVEGYTDSQGTAANNQQLSEDRALTVTSALIGQGVDPARIQAVGLGERYPRASNDTAAGRARNRRVAIIISNNDGKFRQRRY